MGVIKKSKGAISVFLVSIIMAMIILTGVLVDGTRMRTADYEVKNALDISAGSSLTDYNNVLKEMYGLFGLSQSDSKLLEEQVTLLLNKNLVTELGTKEDDEEEHKYYTKFSSYLFGKEKEKQKAFNLFDYRVDNIDVTPLYNLAETDVTRRQILEYMKYRAPKVVAGEILDKLLSFKDLGRQSSILKSKVDVDKKLEEVKKDQINLSDDVEKINTFGNGEAVTSKISDIEDALTERVKLENTLKDLEKDVEEIEKDIDKKNENIDKKNESIANASDDLKKEALKDDLNELEDDLDHLKDKRKEIKKKKADISSKINEKNNLADTIKSEIILYLDTQIFNIQSGISSLNNIKKKGIEANQKIGEIDTQLKDDFSDFADSVRTDTGSKKSKIDEAKLDNQIQELQKNQQVFQSIKENLIGISVDSIKVTEGTSDSQISSSVREQLLYSQIQSDINGFTQTKYHVSKPVSGEENSDPRDAAKGMVDNAKVKEAEAKKEKESKDKERGAIPSDVPGKLKVEDIDSNLILKDILEEDKQEVLNRTKEIDSFEKALLSTGAIFGMEDPLGKTNFEDGKSDFGSQFGALAGIGKIFENGLVDLRDEIYIDEYVMGMFLNELSEKSQERYLTYDKKIDGDYRSRKTFFDKNEVEYIINGKDKEADNLMWVRAQILLVRFALNTIHIYTDPVKSNEAMTMAISLSAWIPFGIPIVHTLIMLAWSMAESVLDVGFIMNGESVPIMKTTSTWVLGVEGGASKLKEKIQGVATDVLKKGAKELSNKAIDYTADKADKLANDVVEQVKKKIDDKVTVTVDKVFKNVQNKVDGFADEFDNVADSVVESTNQKIDENYADIKKIEDEIQRVANTEEASLLEALDKETSALIKDIKSIDYDLTTEIKKEIIAQKEESKKAIRNQLNEIVKKYKDKLKADIDKEIKAKKSELEKTIKTNIDKYKSEGKEKVSEYLDSLGGKTKNNTVTKRNIKGSFLNMGYQDYLRLFLLFVDGNEKVKRIENLIQLNVQKESGLKDFKLSKCNTYLRVDAEASIKYLFVTQSFMPKDLKTEDNRYKIKLKTYKGY